MAFSADDAKKIGKDMAFAADFISALRVLTAAKKAGVGCKLTDKETAAVVRAFQLLRGKDRNGNSG